MEARTVNNLPPAASHAMFGTQPGVPMRPPFLHEKHTPEKIRLSVEPVEATHVLRGIDVTKLDHHNPKA